jgi:hypothetical protein
MGGKQSRRARAKKDKKAVPQPDRQPVDPPKPRKQ